MKFFIRSHFALDETILFAISKYEYHVEGDDSTNHFVHDCTARFNLSWSIGRNMN